MQYFLREPVFRPDHQYLQIGMIFIKLSEKITFN